MAEQSVGVEHYIEHFLFSIFWFSQYKIELQSGAVFVSFKCLNGWSRFAIITECINGKHFQHSIISTN